MRFILSTIILLMLSMSAFGQTTQYAVSDSFAVSTTAFDSTFAEKWQSVNIKFSVPALIKYAFTPLDTLGFRSGSGTGVKQWIRLEAFEVLEIKYESATPGLYRLRGKAVSDAGVCYLDGVKKRYR